VTNELETWLQEFLNRCHWYHIDWSIHNDVITYDTIIILKYAGHGIYFKVNLFGDLSDIIKNITNALTTLGMTTIIKTGLPDGSPSVGEIR
jgi:hypothetical protein